MCRLLRSSILALTLASSAYGAPPDVDLLEGDKEAAQGRMALLNEARQATSRDQELVATGFTLAGGASAQVVLLSHFSEPIEVSVEALGIPNGRFPVGTVEVLPRVPIYLDLTETLPKKSKVFQEGSLRVRFFGDPQMLSGWIVERRGKEVFEIPLIKREEAKAARLQSFWDTDILPGSSPVYFLHNADDTPLVVRILEGGFAKGGARTLHMAPGATKKVHPVNSRGSLEFEHDGATGALVVSGRLENGVAVAALPVVPAESELERGWESLPFALHDSEGHEFEPSLSLFDARRAGDPQQVQVDLLEPRSGAVVLTSSLITESSAIKTVNLRALLKEGLESVPPAMRVKVRSAEPGVLPMAVALSDDGSARDLLLAPSSSGHPSGQYPLPSLSGRSVRTTLLNVGRNSTEVLAHIAWEDGEYALKPLTLSPGEVRQIEIAQIALDGQSDILGRTLDLDYEEGYLQWVSRPSGAIIARTEVLENDTTDTYGFNCATCCPQSPFGELVPDPLLFGVGANPLFQTCVVYFTCTGQTGPFPRTGATLTYSPPFSWNGIRISASGAGEGTPEFELIDETLDFACVSRPTLVMEEGDVVAVDVRITDVSLPGNRISISLGPEGSSSSGQLVVKLRNPQNSAATRTIFQGTRAAGNYTFNFGNLNLYPNNTTYREVFAEWSVGNQVVSSSFAYYLEVLGPYTQTCYNTPREADYGPPEVFVGTSTSACQWGSHPFFHDFLAAVNLNGSGKDIFNRSVVIEFACTNPPSTSPQFCSTTGAFSRCSRFRFPGTIRTSCGLSPTANRTVARAVSSSALNCGDRVYIEGVGERTVEDSGLLASTAQLDHYQGVGQAACSGWGNTQRKTFKLTP